MVTFELVPFFTIWRLQCFRALGLRQFPGHGNENVFYFLSLFGRTLHIGEVFGLAEFIDLLQRDGSLVFKVWLVSDQEKYGILLGVHFNFVHPKLYNAIKWCHIGNVKYQKNTLAASVISTCDGSESLLAGCVPDLELNAFIIDREGFEPKINSNRSQIVFWELILYESHKDGRLSNTWVSDDDCFEEVVVLLDHCFVVLLSRLLLAIFSLSEINIKPSLFLNSLTYSFFFFISFLIILYLLIWLPPLWKILTKNHDRSQLQPNLWKHNALSTPHA